MKKLFFYAAAAVTMVACTDQDYLGNSIETTTSQRAIAFDMKTPATSRADLTGANAATALDNNFVVFGAKGNTTIQSPINADTLVFDHYNVNYVTSTAHSTLSNTADWEYVGQSMNIKGTNAPLAKSAKAQTIKYWDHAFASYDFLGFSLGKGVTTTSGGNSTTTYATVTAVDTMNLATDAYTLEGTIAQLGECYISDITTVKEENYSTAPVVLNFRHLTSKVRMALFETIPGYVIKDVKFHKALTDAHTLAKSDTATIIGDDQFVTNAKYTVFFPTTGLDSASVSDYNKAHVKSTTVASALDTLKLGKVTYANVAEDKIVAGTTYLGQSAAAPSYCGALGSATDKAYTAVMPMENNSKMISIQIDYTLVSTDLSGEEIKVYGARADVPAAYTAWKPGYAYTYLFKISQNTNGHTGPNVDDKGLTAISFDAVVVDDEADGQTTTTTVATPSITTYGYDNTNAKARLSGDEYVAGDSIYATVQDGTNVKPATKLYTVTIEAGAAQTINEASVANCIANGTYDSTAKTYTVTDANGKKLVVTETAANFAKQVDSIKIAKDRYIEMKALAWQSAAATYVVQYVITAPVAATYKITADTDIVSGKTYYTKNTTSGEYEEVANPDKEKLSEYYEFVPAVVGEYAYKVVKVKAAQ